MLTGCKYRLDLTPGQAEFAERIGGACRSVWNTALEQRRIYRRRGGWVGYHDQARQMAEAKGDFPWLAEVPATASSRRSSIWTRRVPGTGRGRSAGSPE